MGSEQATSSLFLIYLSNHAHIRTLLYIVFVCLGRLGSCSNKAKYVKKRLGGVADSKLFNARTCVYVREQEVVLEGKIKKNYIISLTVFNVDGVATMPNAREKFFVISFLFFEPSRGNTVKITTVLSILNKR